MLLAVSSIGDAFDRGSGDDGGPTVVQSTLSVEEAAADAEARASDRRAAMRAQRQELAEARKQRRAREARRRQRERERRERERREAAALAAEEVPPPAPEPEPVPTSGCDSNYSGCVPIASDVDCGGGSGDGPAYLDGTVSVIGSDVYGLDSDSDGTACE